MLQVGSRLNTLLYCSFTVSPFLVPWQTARCFAFRLILTHHVVFLKQKGRSQCTRYGPSFINGIVALQILIGIGLAGDRLELVVVCGAEGWHRVIGDVLEIGTAGLARGVLILRDGEPVVVILNYHVAAD